VTADASVSPDAQALQEYRNLLAQGRFRIQQCRDCGMFCFPPAALCPHCAADELRWMEPSGKAVVHSVALSLGQQRTASTVPALVLVELDEGPRMPGRVMDVEAGAVVPGLPLSAHVGLLEGNAAVLFYNKEQGSAEW
jgi:uncharacterized OB-fold protein